MLIDRDSDFISEKGEFMAEDPNADVNATPPVTPDPAAGAAPAADVPVDDKPADDAAPVEETPASPADDVDKPADASVDDAPAA